MSNKIKIYFSGSINGGMEKAADYRAIIKCLQKHGQVLTAGLWDEELHASLAAGIYPKGWEHLASENATFRQDVNWIEESDVVIADVSTPSHGVGYELATAERLGKMVVALYDNRSARKISWMISGNPYIYKIYYDSLEGVIGELNRNFRAAFGVGEVLVQADQGYISVAEAVTKINLMGVKAYDKRSI